jgi:ribosomal protein L29
MKRKEFNELKTKQIKDLLKLSGEKRLEAKKMKLNLMAGKEKNLKVYRNIRREIAQIETIIREKQIVESLQPKVEAKEEVKAEKIEKKKKIVKKETK